MNAVLVLALSAWRCN